MRSFTELFIDSLVDVDNFIYYLEEGFNPDLLDREEAKAVWHFVREHYDRGRKRQVPELEVLEDEFPKWRFEHTKKEPHYILDKLKEQWEFRKSREVVTTLATAKVDDVFPIMRDTLWEADQVLDTERNVTGEEDVPAIWERYLAQWDSDDRFGYSTGFKLIDEEMGGIRKGQLAVLGGRLKSGKTWFGLKAFNEQVKQQINPLLITLELSVEEIEDRLLALWSGISFNKIDKGKEAGMTPQEMNALQEATIEWESVGPFRIVQPPMGQRKVADLLAIADKYKCGSLIIDQLNWIEARKSNNEYYRDDLRMTDIAMELKSAAQRPGREMPVYVMHQLNRQQKKDEAISDVNFADADGILRTADHGFGIRQTDEQREANVISFEVVASRNSRQGSMFTCDFEFYEKTNMNNAVKGDTVGDMTVDDAAMIVARAFDPDPERVGSLQVT